MFFSWSIEVFGFLLVLLNSFDSESPNFIDIASVTIKTVSMFFLINQKKFKIKIPLLYY